MAKPSSVTPATTLSSETLNRRMLLQFLCDNLDIDASGNLKVSGGGGSAAITKGTWTDRSGTLSTGGTAQSAMNANTSRQAWIFQNTSSGDLWISFVGTAAQASPSIKVAAGGSTNSGSSFVSTQAMSVIGATTGQTYSLWEG